MNEARVEHRTVMKEEALAFLACRPGGVYVDCTVGGGGHSAAILEANGPDGRLIGLDRDEMALGRAGERLAAGVADRRVTLVRANFADVAAVCDELGGLKADGILFDLGVSSFQLDTEERGFSYHGDAPLDMRMDRRTGKTAADLVNTASHGELAAIIREYGEERWAGRIAAFIVKRRETRPFVTTEDLAQVIKDAIPAAARREGPHPARRTFQALRIAVNDELGAIRRGLDGAIEVLRPGGRLVVISFHSLEDRLVKQAFVEGAKECVCPPKTLICTCGRKPVLRILTRHPVVPGEAEVTANPRARSAKLRAAERLGSN